MQHVARHGADRRDEGARRQGFPVALCLLLVLGACVHPAASEGRRALDEGAYQRAAVALESAVRAQPERVDYWVDLGRAYMGQGNAEGATRAFQGALSCEPRSARLHVFLGHARELARDYELAEAAYRKATVLAPERAYPLRVLGARLLRWGRPADAIAPLSRALSLDPAHWDTHNAYAIALAQAGQTEASEQAFRAAIARFPTQRALRLGLAAVVIERGDYAGALAVYDDVVRHWPRFAAAHVGRSILFAQLGRAAEARAALVEAVRLEPQNADYRQRLARYERESAR